MSAAFRCRIRDYQASTDLEKLGRLIAASADAGFSMHYHAQTGAWQAELEFLKVVCAELLARIPNSGDWSLLFEFEIPRRGKRPDVVLLAADLIFILEFKIGAVTFSADDRWQVFSYALDLRDFHLGSEDRIIIPILIGTGQISEQPSECPCPTGDLMGHVLSVETIVDHVGVPVANLISEISARYRNPQASLIEPLEWENAPYRPTPTIIEAAEQIFSGHTVANISHAFATNLTVTCAALLQAIEMAQAEKRRIICFVTGIPGAGKTLAGLSAVHDPGIRAQGRPAAIFLSGNGPLVKIVRAALAQDRRRAGFSIRDVARTISAFIDNVHRFIKKHVIDHPDERPYENAIIFDEAQRAWDAEAVCRFQKVNRSEPQLVLEIMERAPNWSAIIALVGGGQEIYKGEAGLEEWGRALADRPMRWKVLASPTVLGADTSTQRLFPAAIPETLEIEPKPDFHLEVNVRSPRARTISDWVDGVLCGSTTTKLDRTQSSEFPIALTRDLDCARAWLRMKSEAVQRCGLLASSGALRLRPYGIEVSTGFRHGFPYEYWFLAPPQDPRSSMSLEVAATEFECQGLELDWTCVCWGGDFVMSPESGKWLSRVFHGKRWKNVVADLKMKYLKNSYRVLLTRARRGMVIWVPRGARDDPTREPELFDATTRYLENMGVPLLSEDGVSAGTSQGLR